LEKRYPIFVIGSREHLGGTVDYSTYLVARYPEAAAAGYSETKVYEKLFPNCRIERERLNPKALGSIVAAIGPGDRVSHPKTVDELPEKRPLDQWIYLTVINDVPGDVEHVILRKGELGKSSGFFPSGAGENWPPAAVVFYDESDKEVGYYKTDGKPTGVMAYRTTRRIKITAPGRGNLAEVTLTGEPPKAAMRFQGQFIGLGNDRETGSNEVRQKFEKWLKGL
jgi:hypothetical protein